MDPEKRTLKRIELDDAVLADETFTVLMGEKVEPRKEFIEKNAKYAVNLDYWRGGGRCTEFRPDSPRPDTGSQSHRLRW